MLQYSRFLFACCPKTLQNKTKKSTFLIVQRLSHQVHTSVEDFLRLRALQADPETEQHVPNRTSRQAWKRHPKNVVRCGSIGSARPTELIKRGHVQRVEKSHQSFHFLKITTITRVKNVYGLLVIKVLQSA